MGMKEEIFSIATALGYDGPTPTSKTKAVHAVAEVAGSGGGGGAAGYDVTITKVYAVPEQTVTSFHHEQYNVWFAEVTVGDLAQMYEDGQTALTLTVDGVETAATLTAETDPSNAAVYGIQAQGGLGVMPLDGSSYDIGPLTDTEPTAHTVSCYYKDVEATITEEFGIAVNKAVYDKVFNETLKSNGPAGIVADRSLDDINAAYDSGITPAYRLSLPNGTIDGSASSS